MQLSSITALKQAIKGAKKSNGIGGRTGKRGNLETRENIIINTVRRGEMETKCTKKRERMTQREEGGREEMANCGNCESKNGEKSIGKREKTTTFSASWSQSSWPDSPKPATIQCLKGFAAVVGVSYKWEKRLVNERKTIGHALESCCWLVRE